MVHPESPLLSICIATYNRAPFIGATLNSIISQVTPACEIVVSDNASTDDTSRVISDYSVRVEGLRYVRHAENFGLDRNFDSAVEFSRGEYCWLLADDDLLKPGAVARVLSALSQGLSLVLVNKEFRDFSMSTILQRSSLSFTSDRVYARKELDRLFVELGEWFMIYAGGVVIKRSVWIERERERYFGSLFIHVAMVFQRELPGAVLVIAEPLISYRMGNAHSYDGLSKVWLQKWPSILASLEISEWARGTYQSAEPWRHPKWLLMLRAHGSYSLPEYRQWIRPRLDSTRDRITHMLVAIFPAVLINALLVLYYHFREDKGRWLYSLRRSPSNWRNCRLFWRLKS